MFGFPEFLAGFCGVKDTMVLRCFKCRELKPNDDLKMNLDIPAFSVCEGAGCNSYQLASNGNKSSPFLQWSTTMCSFFALLVTATMCSSIHFSGPSSRLFAGFVSPEL